MKLLSLATLAFFVTTTLLAQEEEYKPAHYYDKEGNRVEGYFSERGSTLRVLLFKKNLQSKPEKLKTKTLISLVVGQDSLAVLRNFEVESDASNMMINIPVGLGKVLETGKVNLYEAYYLSDGLKVGALNPEYGVNRKVRSIFIVQQQGSEKFYAVERGIDDYIRQMTMYFKISPPIIEKLNNREYSYPQTQHLVHDFNDWYKNR